jgi:glycerol-3-phosphate dehydrogenase
VNYAEAISALREASRVVGMRVRDRLSGGEQDVRATITINCAGAGINRVMAMFGVQGQDVPLAKAMNLVTSKRASDMGLAAPAAAAATAGASGTRRMLTLTPWHGRALVGTWHSDDFKTPSDLAPTAAEIDAFIADANSAFPALSLTRDDITLVHRGIVPATRGSGGHAELLGSPEVRDHARHGAPGAITVVGVKYTTARAVGAQAAAAATRAMGRSTRGTDTDRAVLPGAGIADHEALAIETARATGLELAPPIIRHLTALYGDRCAAIVRLMAEKSDWRMPLVPGRPNVGAEVIHAIRSEMACTLADIVIRRSEAGAMEYPGDAFVSAVATIAADELGWDAARRDAEMLAVKEFYA